MSQEHKSSFRRNRSLLFSEVGEDEDPLNRRSRWSLTGVGDEVPTSGFAHGVIEIEQENNRMKSELAKIRSEITKLKTEKENQERATREQLKILLNCLHQRDQYIFELCSAYKIELPEFHGNIVHNSGDHESNQNFEGLLKQMELLSRDSNRNGRTSSNSRHFQQVLDELVDNETELDSQTAEPTNEDEIFGTNEIAQLNQSQSSQYPPPLPDFTQSSRSYDQIHSESKNVVYGMQVGLSKPRSAPKITDYSWLFQSNTNTKEKSDAKIDHEQTNQIKNSRPSLFGDDLENMAIKSKHPNRGSNSNCRTHEDEENWTTTRIDEEENGYQKELTKQEKEEMYQLFLDKMRNKRAIDIVKQVRQNITNIQKMAGVSKDSQDYKAVVADEICWFLESMTEAIENHPLWEHVHSSEINRIRDCLEQYTLTKLYAIAYPPSCSCYEMDRKLSKRCRIMDFLTPDHLNVKPACRNDVVLSLTFHELRKVNTCRSPADKLDCIVQCCTVLFNVLNLSRVSAEDRPSADDFLPALIYVVLHSRVSTLYSNVEFILKYRNPADMITKSGFCVTNIRGAIEFILNLNATQIDMDPEEFNRLYTERESQICDEEIAAEISQAHRNLQLV